MYIVKHDIVSGLKYLLVKRKSIRGKKKNEIIVDKIVPSTDACEKMFLAEEEPSGILARGYYDTESQFVDDDCISHLEWNWSFDIRN
ncbi:rho GDP dissociation inhibitor [Helicostylum pulchrum]|nr:rho GDP dissociation inhibitor [Helicostylum pulchrum]